MIVVFNLRGWRRELSAFNMLSNGNPGVSTREDVNKEVEKEINSKTFAVTRNIKTDSWHLAMSNIYEITVCDIDLNDIVATIQELSEITLDDFRTTH